MKVNFIVPNSISIIKLCEVIASDKTIKMEKLTIEENIIKTVSAMDQYWVYRCFEQGLLTKKYMNGNYLGLVFN